MDSHKHHKHLSSLPRTSRVNEKIIEYYKKFGRDRDLEKFMRLYSPSSSKSGSHSYSKSGSRSREHLTTSTTTTTTTSSCDDFSENDPHCGAMRRLFLLNNPECRDSSSETSKSVPDSSQEHMKQEKRREHIIPIRLEDEDEDQIAKEKVEQSSSEETGAGATPMKPLRTQAIQTQTPDSITKTHKRLEWDSLGDVGYIKAMSTSNISILERSLLREFFQETSAKTYSSQKTSANASEGDLQKKLQKEFRMDNKELRLKTPKEQTYKKPLASSTLVEPKELTPKVNNLPGTKADKATTTNTLQLQEKLRQPAEQQQPISKHSQAVQVDMSNATNSTNTCSSTATNCFEYCSSALSSLQKRPGLSVSQQSPKDFIENLQDLISRRQANKDNEEKHSSGNFEIVSDTLKKAFYEDKENSIDRNQFDLGVQLLCSLIDSKSLKNKEKKQLVRDIVKRITQIAPTAPDNRKAESPKSTLKTSRRMKALSYQERKIDHKNIRTISSSSFSSEQLIDIEVYPSPSLQIKSSSHATTSKKAAAALASKAAKEKHLIAPRKEKVEKHVQKTESLENMKQLKSVEVAPKTVHPRVSSSLPNAQKNSVDLLPTEKGKHIQPESSTRLRSDKADQTTSSSSKSEYLISVEVFPQSSNSAASKDAATAGAPKPIELKQTEVSSKKLTAIKTSKTSSHHSEHLINIELFPTSLQPTVSKKSETELTIKKSEQKQLKKLAPDDPASKAEQNKVNNELLIVIQSPTDFQTSSESHKKDEQETNTRRTADTNKTTSSSKEMTTLKAVTKSNSSDPDATMDEWLNPLTQSEIEYEQKKREMEGKAKKDKTKKQSLRVKQPETEREVQLNWIDTEIQRLESLKNLLLEENPISSNRNTVENDKRAQEDSLETYEQPIEDKIYDTVYSDSDQSEDPKSSMLSKSEGRKVREVEVIMEESNEDLVNLRTKLKRTKERKRETQIYYGKPSTGEHMNLADQPTGKALFRRMRETIVTNEDQILSITDDHTKGSVTQRSKIDTPSGSNGSESVGSFVQQRKREFIEHYKNKKKSHYEALQQQQEQQQATAAAQATTTTGHYSVPRTVHRNYDIPQSPTQMYPNYYQHQMQPPNFYWMRQQVNSPHSTQPPPPLVPTPPPPPPTPPPRPERRVSYSAAAGMTSVNSSKTQRHSSSSMFAVSSEISIPMGSNVTSSTTTTTHQYDDVFIGGGIAKAISETTTTTSQKTLPPTKPKSIAYVITFDAESIVIPSQDSAVQEKSTEMPTLQEYLERSRPKFCQNTKERKAIINQIQVMRQERERELRDIIENATENSLDRRLTRLPPPPIRQMRIFPTKQMKALTNKHYARLPEVLEKQQREREDRRRRGNRIIRDVFNSRLQKRVRKGKLSLNHSRTVI